MKQTFKALTFISAVIAIHSIAAPASAITVELAKKCRDMAMQAYPPKLAGAKTGTAAEERTFYQRCISNDGNMSGNEKKDTTPPPK